MEVAFGDRLEGRREIRPINALINMFLPSLAGGPVPGARKQLRMQG
jgi:hypothetical protein